MSNRASRFTRLTFAVLVTLVVVEQGLSQQVAPNFNGPAHSSNYYKEQSGNVRDWEAAGDGVTDDSDNIQKALDSCPGGVYFPPGRYRVTKTLRIKRNNLRLSGEGAASVIEVVPSAVPYNLFLVTSSTTGTALNGIRFDNLSFDGNDSAARNRGSELCSIIRFVNCTNVAVTNCEFVRYGASVGGADDRESGENEAIALRDVTGFRVTGNHFGDAGGGRSTCVWANSASTRGTINDNVMNGQCGIGIYAARDTTITGNVIANKLREGVIIDYTDGSLPTTAFTGTIANNTFKRCDGMAIYLFDTGSPESAVATGKVVIASNTIDASGWYNIGQPAAISVTGCKFPVAISGNVLTSSGMSAPGNGQSLLDIPAIGIWNCADITVLGNTISDSTGSGILISQTRPIRATVSGNTLRDVGGLPGNQSICVSYDVSEKSLRGTALITGNLVEFTKSGSANLRAAVLRGEFSASVIANKFSGNFAQDEVSTLGFGLILQPMQYNGLTASGKIGQNTFTRLRVGIGSGSYRTIEDMSFQAEVVGSRRLSINDNQFTHCNAAYAFNIHPNGIIGFVGSSECVQILNQPIVNYDAVMTWPGNPYYVNSTIKQARTLAPHLVWETDTAPSAGPNAWRIGDTAMNVVPAANQPIGWVWNGAAWKPMGSF